MVGYVPEEIVWPEFKLKAVHHRHLAFKFISRKAPEQSSRTTALNARLSSVRLVMISIDTPLLCMIIAVFISCDRLAGLYARLSSGPCGGLERPRYRPAPQDQAELELEIAFGEALHLFDRASVSGQCLDCVVAVGARDLPPLRVSIYVRDEPMNFDR